ncbi:MAG: hypothetical protein C0446_14205 [Chitinophaga sp.]|nr:hypothetical protein [Chitinophaga sp.]
MNSLYKLRHLLILVILLIGCQKKDLQDNSTEPLTTKKNIPPAGFFIENRKVPGVVSDDNVFSREQTTINSSNSSSSSSNPDPNNGDEPIILGQQLPNPYTVANMQAAVNILYGGNYPITASHLYVRFKPSSSEQLVTLDETEDLELQDYPIDYELIQDGDYYQDPTLGTEDFHWLYTVVPANYNFPQGIQHEVLEQLYLPENNEILEDLAESIVQGAQYQSTLTNAGKNTVKIARLDVQVNDFIFDPDPCFCPPTIVCLPDPNCDGGGNPPTPTLPSGIYVEEQTVCNQDTRILPLRQVNIVAKRWFKFWRGFTDDNGKFTVTKNFRNKVKVIVKTKNGNARVSKVRGIRLWQMLFPTRKRIGVFNGSELPSIRYVFTKPTDGSASNKDLAYWASATTHNSIVEFREHTTEFNLTQPPSNLKVMVTNWGFMENSGAAPMWNKCNNNLIPASFATFFVANSNFVLAGVTVLTTILKNQMDMIIGYKSTDYNCFLTSSQLRSVVYHELGHAQHYSQAGCDFWTQYRNGIVTELSKLNQVDFHPYGTGNDQSTAPILATGEMWGNHVEKWYSERHYGNGGPVAANFISRLQGLAFSNNAASGLNANYWSIENFNPNRNQDVHRWIPQGIPYDLFDNRDDGGFPIATDNVHGFTINQSFNALQPDVRSIPAFRDRLLQQNANAQQVQVTQLFQRYGY